MIKVRGNQNSMESQWKPTKNIKKKPQRKHVQHNYSSDKIMCNKRPMIKKLSKLIEVVKYKNQPHTFSKSREEEKI